jgi:hypothetical protein
MAADSSTPPEGGGEPRLSWRDRELVTALRRLANSRAQVQSLEAALERQRQDPEPDPADLQHAQSLQAELVKLRAKASSRFGGGAARERIPEVELQQRLILDRLGFDSYDELEAAGRRPAPAAEPVDTAFVEFARRELADAEAAYAQLLSMPDDGDDALPPTRTIDLTRGESSA